MEYHCYLLDKYYHNWSYFDSFANVNDPNRAYSTTHLFYSYSILIWEILTRNLPFSDIQQTDSLTLYNYLKNKKLSCLPMKNNIPLEVYDFIFKILNNVKPKEYFINKAGVLFTEVDNFPENEIDVMNLKEPEDFQVERSNLFSKTAIPGFCSKFRNTYPFDLDYEFIEGIEGIRSCELSEYLFVQYIGCGIKGYCPSDWYFYTEELGLSLAQKMEMKLLDDKDKFTSLSLINLVF